MKGQGGVGRGLLLFHVSGLYHALWWRGRGGAGQAGLADRLERRDVVSDFDWHLHGHAHAGAHGAVPAQSVATGAIAVAWPR